MAYSKSKVNKKARLMKNNLDGGAYAAKNPAAPAKEIIKHQNKVAQAGGIVDDKTKEVFSYGDFTYRPKQRKVVTSDTTGYTGPQPNINPSSAEVTSMNLESFKDFQQAKAAAKRPGGSNSSKIEKRACRLKQVSDGSKIAKMGNPYRH